MPEARTRRHLLPVKIALVTGASRGIGLAVAVALRARGMHVVRVARSLTDAAAERRTDIACDMTNPADVERPLARVEPQPGVPDVPVNHAGISLLTLRAETTPAAFA